MSIIDIILTGIAWILAATLIFTVIAGALLVTWMQVNDRKETQQ